ncbi:MAG: transglycosylase SLT domain-containing protein [Xanthobacteraceae bacterium]
MAWSVAALVALVPAADAAVAKTVEHKIREHKSPQHRAAGAKHGKKKTILVAEVTAKTVPLPRPRPRMIGTQVASSAFAMEVVTTDAPPAAAPSGLAPMPIPAVPPMPASAHPALVFAAAATSVTPPGDLAAMKRVIDLSRHGKESEATEAEHGMEDPVARKLAEWIILRREDNGVSFDRYVAFLTANPSWPSIPMLRRKAEAALFEDHRDGATIRAFFANEKPTTAKGKFALARALLAQGDRAGAAAFARDAWRRDSFSHDVETTALANFEELLTKADHKARMDCQLYAHETEAALRAAQRLGPTEVAIAKARAAVSHKSANVQELFDAVPAEAHRDPGLIFSRIVWLHHREEYGEAVQLMLAAPNDPALIHDTDQWWVERRQLARKLLDLGDAKTAYQIARDAAPPAKENYRAEHQFTSGWIALRFLNDPETALVHFSHIADGITNPIALARAGYWQGRAAEALGRTHEARAYYEAAARYSTAYYGQLARGRLGLPEIILHAPAEPPPEKHAELARLEVGRAVELLYALNERDFILPFMVDLAERAQDIGALSMLAEIARRHEDARAMVLLGKAAMARGLAFDFYAFPSSGVPNYSPVGPNVERAVLYSIIRQESEFNPKDYSSAKAMGLMQVTPDAGRYVASKFHAKYDQKRLMSDLPYNLAMGAAELGELIQDYRGSYILAFVGYNAGRGRVREWVARYGDPRDPSVDPVDWVERIPFSETRNYVERVLENLQVYRTRFGGGTRLMIDADMRRGTSAQD